MKTTTITTTLEDEICFLDDLFSWASQLCISELCIFDLLDLKDWCYYNLKTVNLYQICSCRLFIDLQMAKTKIYKGQQNES